MPDSADSSAAVEESEPEEPVEPGSKWLGITPPISEALPTVEELSSTEELKRVLRELGTYESPAESAKREEVIKTLQDVACIWSEQVAQNFGLTGVSVVPAIHVFGSYALGVHSPDADIDVLLIAPRHCRREDFFGSFCEVLRALSDVSELSPVPDAYTPVLKLKVSGVPIDMLFVALHYAELPCPFNIEDSDHLRGLDEQGLRSLNGARVAQMILRLVPNHDAFRVTLRAVREWARRSGVYSNVLGFLGGINWAILVAFICQRYPNATPAILVQKFFRVYHRWKWPNPILLAHIAEAPPEGCLAHAVWNPKVNPRDRAHIMPIVTPAYPSMNSSYNVGEPQLRMMKEAFAYGMDISAQIIAGQRDWTELFVDTNFFWRFADYLQVDVSAGDVESHRRWLGWIESRLRQLIVSMEQPRVMTSHPLARTIPNPEIASSGIGQVGSSFFIGLSFEPETEVVDVSSVVQDFVYKVNLWDGRTSSMDVRLNHRRGHQLPQFVFPDGRIRRKKRDLDPSDPI